jgi:hypothetical protein
MDEKVETSNSEMFESNNLKIHKIKTLPRATKYEIARIIGTRASQIQYGSPVIILKDGKHSKIPEKFKNIKSAEDKARLELLTKSSPIIIKRTKPSGKYDLITIQELE